MTTVREELTQLAGVEQKEGETWSKFSNRLVKVINKMDIPDDDWAKLSPETQEWYNTAVEKISNGQPNAIPAFPGETVPEEETKPKAAKGAKKGEGAKGVRPPKLGDDMTITLVVDKNPKRPGSAAHTTFEKYKSGMTVGQAIKAGVPRSDINWNVTHGYIKVE